MKKKKYKKNQKEKNTKKLKNKKSAIGKNLETGIVVAKKEKSCQEGKNLVNRRLLFLTLHLAAHLLAILYSCFHAFACLLFLLFCSCIHGLSLVTAQGHSPLVSLF